MWRVGAQVSREPPPPLPGGYTVGEQIYFTGAGQTVEGDYRLEYGKQGEVTGPATCESHTGKGVDVSFPGNMGLVCCCLTQVSRRRRRTATHSSPPPWLELPLLSAQHTLRVRVACGRMHR